MGGLQGGGVVGAVARNGHHLALLLQGLDQALLVHGAGARDDFQVEHAVAQFLVAQGGKLGARYLVAGSVALLPQADAPPNLAGRGRRVARHDFHGYAGLHAAAHGGRHLVAHGIGDGGHAQERKARGRHAAVGYRGVAVGELLHGKAQRAHGLVLIAQQEVVELGVADVARSRGAQAAHNLGRALDVEDATALAARHGRAHHRGHILALGREGELLLDGSGLAQGLIAHAAVVEPQEQGALGGVAHHAGRAARRGVEKGGGVDGDALGHEGVGALALRAEDAHLAHAHLVLRERAGLVGADNGGGAHRLAGMHLAHQVVGLQHAAHAQGQREGDAHGQTLGDGHDDERDGYHHRLEQIGHEVDPPERFQAVEIGDEAPHQDETGQHVAHLRDDSAQAVELVVERRLDAVVDLGGHKHFAVLGGVAHVGHAHQAVTVDDGGAAQHAVGGIGGVFVEVLRPHRLFDDGLARERRLVDLHRHGFDELSVGRYLNARVEHDEVAHNDVALGHLLHMAVAHHLHGIVIVHLVEHVEGTVGLHLEPEADARGQHDGHEDARRFQEDAGVASLVIFEAGDAHRGQQRHEQDADDGVFKLFEKLPPQRFALGRRQYVFAILAAALGHLFGRQSLSMFRLFHYFFGINL